MIRRDAHEQNRKSWNAVTPAHNRHKGDQAAFLRDGGSTLFPEERALLGDVSGRRVVHLQCNCGQDTLSIARMGADVLGVDISDAAVAVAQGLSTASGIPGRFVRADLVDWFGTESGFDVVFASYGALPWLSDLETYFRGVAGLLAPGGRYVLVEFHPVMWIFDGAWRHTYPYSTHGNPLHEPGVSDYVARSEGGLGAVVDPTPFVNPEPTEEFAWGLGDVLGAALAVGLRLEHVAEYPWTNGCKVQEPMKRLDGNRWTVPDGKPELPLMYSVVATRG
jgi:SAM-dependent methyltransferase